jgi:hypothetical protein
VSSSDHALLTGLGLADVASPRAAQAYMLISMPTGISTICGVFQDMPELLVM